MTPLQNLQHPFQQALLQDRALESLVLTARGVAQFGVYRVAYRARLRAALAARRATALHRRHRSRRARSTCSA